MTVTVLTLVLAALVVAFFMHAQRQHDHHVARLLALIEDTHQAAADRADAMTGRFIAALSMQQELAAQAHPDLAALIAQNDRLCQRLQAPEHAIMEHTYSGPLPDLPQVAGMDDDAAAFESAEEYAERLMSEELARG